MYRKISLLIAFLGFSSLTNATLWVGGDANCDYSSIQPALNEMMAGNETHLYIANNNVFNGVYNENLTYNNTQTELIRIKGGYDHCEGDVTDVNTEINGGGFAPVFNISGNDNSTGMRISNLNITNGAYDAFQYSGGLNIIDNQLSIDLTRVIISNNQGYHGGGIFSGGGTGLVIRLYETLVTNNNAEFGGGIYCLGNKISMYGESGIANNSASSTDQARGMGGGIYMEDGCDFLMSAGDLEAASLAGITGNSATGHGGGTFVNDGSLLRLTQAVEGLGHVVYKDNMADFDNDGFGNGGAVYLSGLYSNLVAERQGVIIKNNSAVNGGALALANDSQANIKSASRCSMNTPCIVFSGNTAGQNTDAIGTGRGGVFHVNDAYLKVSRSSITDSHADFGVVGYAENSGVIDMDFDLIHNNGRTPDANFDQNNLFVNFSGGLKLTHVTVVDNILSASEAMVLGINNAYVLVNNSILQALGNQTFDGITSSGTNLDLSFKCNVMHEVVSIGASSSEIRDNTQTTTPGFINSAEQNYRLSAGSISVDKCNEYITTPLDQLDLEGRLTGVDDPTKTNVLGTYDAGASESYQWDVIFEDGFE